MTSAIRREIHCVLRDELSIEPPPAGTDLIASGLLDSLTIVSLLVELERRFRITIPLDGLDLESIRTIERLEALVENSDARPSVDEDDPLALPLVPLRAGHGRPIYLAHDSYGGAVTVQPIAEALDTNRPIVALQARGVDPDAEPELTIEAMADSYVTAIRRLQPHGPYALIGNSFGGLVAYEMARRLVSLGERVDTLALIDTHADPAVLDSKRRANFYLRAPVRYARVISDGPSVQIPRYARRVRTKLNGGPAISPEIVARGLPPRTLQLKVLAEEAEAAYRPGDYGGDVILFVAASRPPGRVDPMDVWPPRVRGTLVTIELAGDHGEVLGPLLPTVSGFLSDRLEKPSAAAIG